MPFDRLTRAVDEWAGAAGRSDVVAQIGETEFRPQHMEYSPLLDPERFRAEVDRAEVIVSHAGMGSIITALQHAKPIIVMPRRGDLQETRNDHQVATAERFRGRPGVIVAMDEAELVDRLGGLASLPSVATVSQYAERGLLDTIRAFIQQSNNGPVRAQRSPTTGDGKEPGHA